MNTLIINGSPRAERGNTEVFIRQFVRGAGRDYPVQYAAKEPPEELAKLAAQADTLLVFLPLYVHSVPGILLKLFERMAPARSGQRIGFVVQAGFIEGAQVRFLVRYLNAFARRLGYEMLGVVTRGDAAGTAMVPAFMPRGLFRLLRTLGAHYARTGTFHDETARKLAGMYELTPGALRLLKIQEHIGLSKLFWHKFWKDNGVLRQGIDRPFAPAE